MAEQIAAMRAEYLGAKSGFFHEFSGNVFSRGRERLELGGVAPLDAGGNTVMVIQNSAARTGPKAQT